MRDFHWNLKRCDKNSMKKNSSYPRVPQKLVRHSGPLDAGVGVVLHVQHYKPEDEDTHIARPFWDLHNQSIQVLAQKGYSDTFTFCFDWHWRAAAESLRCLMKTWGRQLRACHGSFSSRVLEVALGSPILKLFLNRLSLSLSKSAKT